MAHANHLADNQDNVTLLAVAYQSAIFSYGEHRDGQPPKTVEVEDSPSGKHGIASFTFSDVSGFTPVQMDVQKGSKVRGDIPARVCLLGRDKAVYRTYVFPEDWQELADGDVMMEGSQ